MIEYYIIAAISFALMYAYNYGWAISKTVLDVLNIFDINYKEESDVSWNPTAYILSSFIVALIGMPFFLYIILFENKYKTIKNASGDILKKSFGFEKQKINKK